MGGEISVQSEKGIGSTFCLTIPCMQVPQATVGDESKSSPSQPRLSASKKTELGVNGTVCELHYWFGHKRSNSIVERSKHSVCQA